MANSKQTPLVLISCLPNRELDACVNESKVIKSSIEDTWIIENNFHLTHVCATSPVNFSFRLL